MMSVMNDPYQKVPMQERLIQTGYKSAYFLWKFVRRFFLSKTYGAQVAVWLDDRILLVKSCYRETYCLPGGYVKRGEEALLAAQRELEEETGLLVLTSQLKFVRQFSFKCHNTDCFDSVFQVELADGSFVAPTPDGKEIIDARFFSRRELENMPLDINVQKYLSFYSS